MKNFSGIVAWYSADHIPGILSCSSNISISLIFILNSKISLVFKTEMLNWTANEESLWRVLRSITTLSNRMKFRLGCIHVCTFSRVHSSTLLYCEIRIQNSLKCAFLIEQRQLQFMRHFVLPGKKINAVFQPPIENFQIRSKPFVTYSFSGSQTWQWTTNWLWILLSLLLFSNWGFRVARAVL